MILRHLEKQGEATEPRMTNSNENIQSLLEQLTLAQIQTQAQIQETQVQIQETSATVQELSSDVNRVLGRSAILDDVLLELRDSHEQHQQNFEQHQRNFERNFEQYQQSFS
jgi:predicted  nucleic acid-binding Zn-ribbon protein